ncbi:MAG: site-specific DNA-methyltransferase [Candidatus Methanoperedens sp.]
MFENEGIDCLMIFNDVLKIPYTQQFSPSQTPLNELLALLKNCIGKDSELKKAIADSFFKDKVNPEKLAGNTIIALKNYGIITTDCNLTTFGKQLVDSYGDAEKIHELLAKHILFDMNGIALVETLKEMKNAGLKIDLKSLPDELRKRGIQVSNNSSDLSGILNWLRESKLLDGYDINYPVYEQLMGTKVQTIEALKSLTPNQISFLRAMVALNITDWIPYNDVCKHAEALFPGEINFNWKEIPTGVLRPLQEQGFIEIRKKGKKDDTTPEGRGGKPADVKPTSKFIEEVADPILNTLHGAAGFSDVRDIRSKSLEQIVSDVRHNKDPQKRGLALELLAIRLCQMLDLEFMNWRATDEEIAAGGEIDAMLHSARLIYSRWQVQCKASDITLEAVAKEVGMSQVTLSNVILIVGTGRATEGAVTYKNRIVASSNLNIIIIEGKHLDEIIKNNLSLIEILNSQASNAMKHKGNFAIGMVAEKKKMQAFNEIEYIEPIDQSEFIPSYKTDLGSMYCGDSLEVLPYLINQGVKVKLIVTSPPFALIKKKDYGNEDAEKYVDWFMKFVPYFKQILEPDGSLVIDIGGSWIKGLPVKSTYHFNLLTRLCENGFYLAQDFYHYNPAKLPTPAEWVTIRRLRVKDAVNNVWWLVLDPFVDADNRRILKPYSESMKQLLINGYTPKHRPSGHDISTKFQKDNGGAIPPNLFEFSNTESLSHYLSRCKEQEVKPHPARFPIELPDFFIKFLTKENDIILDPFAGSNVTGEAGERLNRKWIAIELNYEYVVGSKFRFEQKKDNLNLNNYLQTTESNDS